MRRVRYGVAMSLDGYIAGPHGEADWIVMDPEMDFAALWREFDTLLIGRKTYEYMLQHGSPARPRIRMVVFSRTLQQAEHTGVEIVADGAAERVTALREQDGKDMWLSGGGELFRSLLDAGLVDTVEVAVVPVLLGGGVPLLGVGAERTVLTLIEHRVYGTGIVQLKYQVAGKM